MFPGVLSALLVGTVGISAVLGAIVLDVFAIRLAGGGSLTTMFPGFVYATALIFKVSLIEAVVLAVGVAMKVFNAGNTEADLSNQRRHIPVWGITSVLLPATAPFMGAVVIIFAQALSGTPEAFSLDYLTRISRVAVFALIAVIAAATFLAIYSLVRRERPLGVPLTGLATTLVYWVLFRYWEFYKLGFDQDRWNDI